MDTLGIDSEDSASLAKRKLERNVKDMQDFSDLLRDNDPLNENSTENPNLIQQKCETEDRYGDNPRKYDVLCEIYSNLGDSSATMKGLQAQVLKLMAAETKIRAGEKKEIVGYKNKIHFLKETLNRKEEEFQVVREKLDKKRSELNRLKVFKRDKLATVDKMLTDLEAFLEHYKELLKFKNERISEDEKRSVAHQILEQEFASVKQELDAYRKAPKLEQNDLDLASGHEKHVFNPWRKEISELRAKASSAEDASARLRDQLEALNIKYKKCKEKYAILKERTKEHHEGLDHETNEYAKTVLKRNYEYQSILDESSLDESIIVKKKVTGRDNKRRTTKILQEPQVHESETVEILKKLNAASPSQDKMKNEDFSTAVDKKQITCKDYEDREFTLKNGKEYRNQSADAFNSSDGLPPFSHMNIASYLKYEVQLKKFKGDLLTAEYNFRQYRELVLKCENLFLKCQENIETLTNEINQSKLAIDASSSAMLKDLEILIVEIQEREKKVKKLMAHKEEIREALKKEWEKMIQMDEEHERDKDEALDEREEYYSNLQSDSIKLKREKAAKNSQHLKQQYEARDKKLTEELTEIKMFHKNICKEKHRLIAELEVEKNKLKESREKENNFEVETSQRKLSEEMSLQVAEKDRLNREVIQNQD